MEASERYGQPSSEECLAALPAGSHILLFSGGKDSLAAWLHLSRREDIEVIPLYCYTAPGLGFVERYLEYCEDFFGTGIVRLPYHDMVNKKGMHLYQPVGSWEVIEGANFRDDANMTFFASMVVEEMGLDQNETWICTGFKAADSFVRRNLVKKKGPMRKLRGFNLCEIIWDWNKDRIIEEVTAAGLDFPEDYRLFGRSFEGATPQMMDALSEAHPEDYEKFLRHWPMAKLQKARKHFAFRRYGLAGSWSDEVIGQEGVQAETREDFNGQEEN